MKDVWLALLFSLLVLSPLLLALTGSWLWRNRWRLERPSSAAVAIVTLVRANPEGWKRGAYVWHHPHSGLNIWISNEDYGLRWWVGSPDAYNCPNPPKADQRYVWNALQPVMASITNDVARLALEALRTAPIGPAANVVRIKTH